jgi:hypothetical protein
MQEGWNDLIRKVHLECMRVLASWDNVVIIGLQDLAKAKGGFLGMD